MSKKSAGRSRGYVFTLNNYTPEEVENVKLLADTDEVRYLVFGHEVAPTTGTPHLQGFILFENQTAFGTVRKLIPRANIQTRRATDFQASEYCKKEGDFFEAGTAPQQGRRFDIENAVKAILDGTTTTTEIVTENPTLYICAHRALDKVQSIRISNTTSVIRKEQREAVWYYGGAGVGKSKRVFEQVKDDSFYLYPYDGDWMDSYDGQKYIVFDDFRGQVPYNALLRLTDPWYNSYQCRRRGTVPYPCVSDKIVITSALPPWEVYGSLLSKSDSLKQLFRRVKIIQMTSEGDKVYELANADDIKRELGMSK